MTVLLLTVLLLTVLPLTVLPLKTVRLATSLRSPGGSAGWLTGCDRSTWRQWIQAGWPE
jgi:hypothetical protein